VGLMRIDILNKIYANDLYLTYLRYHPNWYIILNEHPEYYIYFEKELKKTLKITTSDKVANLKKQVDFINGIVKYLHN
jgi:hypothetical protein